MTANIGCFVSGCTNPVVGQCPGYKKGCGRFYCAEHNFEGLCIECANEKREDEVLEDYAQTAQNVLDGARYPFAGCRGGIYGLLLFSASTGLGGYLCVALVGWLNLRWTNEGGWDWVGWTLLYACQVAVMI